MENEPKTEKLNPHKNKIHKLLLHSHSSFLLFFLIGVFLDILYPVKIFEKTILAPVGIAMILFATLLIFWSQKSNRTIPVKDLGKHAFAQGPYRYVGNPTHWGLFFLLFGFSIAINALYLVVSTLAYLIAGHFFIKKQDCLLEDKYGEHFKEYKKTVKF